MRWDFGQALGLSWGADQPLALSPPLSGTLHPRPIRTTQKGRETEVSRPTEVAAKERQPPQRPTDHLVPICADTKIVSRSR